MRTRIKVTDLTNPQWAFIERFVGSEYPLDGTAVRVCYELAPGVEFNTVMPFAKFVEIGEHLGRLDKYGHPYIDPDQQDDWERENRPQTVVREAVEADQAKMREMVEIIGRMCETVDGMRADLRAWKNEPVSTYPKEMLR
jgi:hypothetical protein